MDSNGINIFSSEIFTPLLGGFQRYFTDLQSSLSQYYTLNTVTLTGDFEIEMDFTTTSTSNMVLLGDSHTASLYFNLSGGTTLNVWIAGTNYGYTVPNVSDGKLHTAKYVLTGTSLDVFLDGVSAGAQTVVPYTGANDFRIGSSNSIMAYFNGYLANFKITNGSTLTHDLPLDEDLSTTSTAINYGSIGASGNATAVNITESDLFTQVAGDWEGVELVTNGGFDTDSAWTKGVGWTISGGKANRDGNPTNSVIEQPLVFQSGVT